jgi:hypothetical protein
VRFAGCELAGCELIASSESTMPGAASLPNSFDIAPSMGHGGTDMPPTWAMRNHRHAHGFRWWWVGLIKAFFGAAREHTRNATDEREKREKLRKRELKKERKN